MHLVLKFWLWGRFVAEKQTYVLNLMAGHLLNMTYNENGKWNVWELDHYTDRSSLVIHFWDLYWKMAYLKFERFWYSNVRPWETVQIWGDCPPCSRSIFVVKFGILMACDNLDIASLFQVQFSSAWKRRDSQDILSESQKFSRWVVPKPPLLGGCCARPSLMTTFLATLVALHFTLVSKSVVVSD